MQQEEPEHLKYIDRSENARYNSEAVFSDLGIGVEVKEYDSFTLYTWRGDFEFEEVVSAVEPYFPFTEDPAVEMLVEKEALRYRSERDHTELRNDFVYDPVREWRGEERWEDYELIQLNLNGCKVAWDEKEEDTRIRVYDIEDRDVFEKLFEQLSEKEVAGILGDMEDMSLL